MRTNYENKNKDKKKIRESLKKKFTKSIKNHRLRERKKKNEKKREKKMHIVEFDESEFDLKQQQQQPVHSTDTWHNLSGTCSD